MINPILDNYDTHVNHFIRFLRDRLQCRLVYLGPKIIRHHILQKTVYACSVYCKPKKYLKDVFPIMIGSQLDFAIRHCGLSSFEEPLHSSKSCPFEEVDIGRGFFIINGFLRHIPYFYTNDPTNTHVIQKKIVRVYSYNAQDRGKELSYYVSPTPERRYGEVVVVHNDGRETSEDPTFFSHCPYPVHLTAYMTNLYRHNTFDIDHLGNKMVVSPGHLFTKLFIKYLYGPLQAGDWKLIKSRTALIRHSIDSGCLLHVLSRKTVYFKEGKSAGKMTNEPHESHREIGSNGEIFIEKSMGCYREISTQTYPLNPFLLYLIVRQMSNKVNHATLDPYHPSQEGWFCKLGVFDTKNVGRMNTMVRETIVSTCDDLDPVYHESWNLAFWNVLQLVPQADSPYYVVVNEACIPVTRASFLALDPLVLKRTFHHIECFVRDKFMVLRYKMGLMMKKLPETDIWVTPYDELYWARLCFQIEDQNEMMERWPVQYSYFVDLNPYFHHNAFLKNILAFNALKNAVLATTSKYALYFMDSVSTYRREPTADHQPLMIPVADGISPHFVVLLPHIVVTYMSFLGLTQEDCIVKHQDFRGFDCFRFYTLRLKVKATTWVKFYPVHGDVDEESNLLGTLISGEPLDVEPYSIHVRSHPVSPCEVRLTFSKSPFRIIQHFLTEDKLMISVEQEHVSSTGDKLCSLHGQKGVIRVMSHLPRLDGDVEPTLLINPYCMFRMTTGQPLEALHLGEGRDALTVHNSEGRLMEGASALYGKTFYFVVVYFSCEHMYAPDTWVMDKVILQPVKGRSRQGGMKLGNMEVNALRGNGIACCFEEKFFEDGDRVPVEGQPTETVPQAMCLVEHDFAYYKCHLEHQSSPALQMCFNRQNCLAKRPRMRIDTLLIFSNEP